MRKFLPYIIIFFALVGLFGPMAKVSAETQAECQTRLKDQNTSNAAYNTANPPPKEQKTIINQSVIDQTCNTGNGGVTPQDGQNVSGTSATVQSNSKQTPFEQQFDTAVICMTSATSINVGGCLVSISYYLFYKFPAFLLAVTAEFFNTLVGITLSSTLFSKSEFIPTGWAVVRDLSNLFFILALLYIAIKIILGIDTSGAKKMITYVIITAMLINFSMFFTQVVIDTSNVLALIFYNKMQVDTKNPDKSDRPYTPLVPASRIGFPIKDISGGMVNAFNPTSQLNWDNFFKAARDPKSASPLVSPDGEPLGSCRISWWFSPLARGVAAPFMWNDMTERECKSKTFLYLNITYIGGWTQTTHTVNSDGALAQVPSGIMMSLILVTGAIMLFACYAFLWAGLAFMGRLLELWVLIIFSPFAFVSFAVPILNEVPYIGWGEWSKRLLKTAFMAPIFMFFMYLIFMLVQAKLFNNLIGEDQGMVATLLLIGIPAMVILILLLKATEFAKKGSGKFGEIAMKGLQMAGGLALGAVTGGTALLGTKALGGLAADQLTRKGETWREQANKGGFEGLIARMKLKTADYGQKATYDFRNTGAGKAFSKESGINLSRNVVGLGPKEGGFKGAGERKAAELKKESELYKTTKSDTEVAAIAKAKMAEYEEKKNKAEEEWIFDPKNKEKNTADFNREYEEENGKPVFPQTANQLNNERLRAFSNNVLVGSHGLLGSLAYQYRKNMGQIVDNKNYQTDEGYKKQFIKKHGHEPAANEKYDASIANEVNRNKVENTKMLVGGVLGTGVGAIAAHTSRSSRAGEAKFSKELEKGIGKMSKVTDRIAENTTAIKNLESVLANGNNLMKDFDGKSIKLVKENGSVDTQEIEKQLHRIATIDDMNKLELKKLYEQGLTEKDEPVQKIIKMSMENAGTKWQLDQLKTAPDNIHKRKTENVKLSESQEKIDHPPAAGPAGPAGKDGKAGKAGATGAAGASGSSGGHAETPAHGEEHGHK